jgi:hypothetical protein
MSYQVPAGQFENEYVVKKSRFIARVLLVASREEVNAAVKQSRLDYPDARYPGLQVIRPWSIQCEGCCKVSIRCSNSMRAGVGRKTVSSLCASRNNS